MTIARFAATTLGRVLRIIIGITLIWIGVTIDKPAGYFLEVIGLIPIIAGLFNLCFLAPLIGAPFRGSDLPPE